VAGSKGSKYFDVFLSYHVWLTSKSKEGKLTQEVVSLLKEIEQSGSLKKAAEKRQQSYRKAWGDLQKAEQFVGFPLVEATRGGKDGGLTRLSPDGIELVKAFDELAIQFDTAIHDITRRFFRELNKEKD